MAKSSGWTIAIRPEAAGPLRKITKIMPLADGGFSVLMPYHMAKTGHLFKAPYIDRGQMPLTECVNYSAKSPVKLSYHVDGFAQFSSQAKGSILSGRDPNTGEPKGLGLMTNPLTTPITTGGSAAVGVRGLEDFEIDAEGNSEIQLTPEDFYFRNSDESSANVWIIHIFCFLKLAVPPVKIRNGIKYFQATSFALNRFMFPVMETILLELGNKSPVNLALQLNRAAARFPTKSGWTISGPGDHRPDKPGHVLMAVYPASPKPELDAASLDWPPSADAAAPARSPSPEDGRH